MSTESKKQQIEWRRSKVLEYLAQGLNQRQIAEKLQLDPSTISSDVAVLRQQSKERIRTHLEDRLPFAFETCLTRLEASMRQANEILNSTEDKRTKLQAIQIINDSTSKYMDLLTHTGTVEAAMSYAEKKANRHVSDISTKKDKTDGKEQNNQEVTTDNDTERFAEDNTREAAANDRRDEAVF